ncbi:hypothetical protein L6R50_13860 [Myxococcota bacterium]|nr:hypothetical protein [Myxococcota bacterium]
MRFLPILAALTSLAAACSSDETGPACSAEYKVVISVEQSSCSDAAGVPDETYWYCMEADGSQVALHYAARDGDERPEPADWHFLAEGTLQSGAILVYETDVLEDRDPEEGSVLYSISGEATLDAQNVLWDGTETITVYADADSRFPDGCSHVSTVKSEIDTGT